MDWIFTRPPLQSLKDIALIKTVTLLWTPVHSYKLSGFGEYKNKWQEIEEKIAENVRHFKLPKSIEEQIMYVLNPIGLQILKWIKLHKNKLPSSHILPNKFCWAQEGTIDLKRTAEIIVRNEEISARCRYELASIYSLENHIQFLWNEMPEVDRQGILCQDVNLDPDFAIKAYWVYVTMGDDNLMNLYVQKQFRTDQYSHHLLSFLEAAKSVNVVATKYFWKNLTSHERNKALPCLVTSAVRVAKKRTAAFHDFDCESYADVLFFLMLQMTKEDQVKTFKGCPLEVLMCLADWPWQYNLLTTLNRMWNVIQKDDYVYFLLHLSNTASSSIPKSIYQQLLSEVWRNTPVEFKQYTVKQCYFEMIIHHLFRGEDRENIKLILGSDEATAEVKNSVLCSFLIMSDCESLVEDGQWEILQFFVKECVSSRNGANDFKRRFLAVIEEESAGNKRKFLIMLKNIVDTIEQE